MSLAGKTAVVTGAAGNTGMAVVRALLEDGLRVALVDVDAMRLDSLVRFLRGNTHAVACDVGDAAAVKAAFAEVEKVLGPVEVLVNAASQTSLMKLRHSGKCLARLATGSTGGAPVLQEPCDASSPLQQWRIVVKL